MIKTSLKKIFPTLLITNIVCFLAIFLFYQVFPPSLVMTGYRFSYIFRYSLLKFLDFLIPIHCTGLLLAYGLFITEDDLTSTKGITHPFHQAVSPVLVFLLVLVVGYTLLIAWTYSLTLNKVQEIEHKTVLFNTYFDKALEARDNGRQSEALQYLAQCLLLDEKSNKASGLYAEIQVYMLEHDVLPGKDAAEGVSDSSGEGLDVEAMVKKARQFFYKQDWFSAYYYASLAYQSDNNNLIAYDLIRDTLARIESHTLSLADQKQQELYKRKKLGFDALKNGKYAAAYYIFRDLSTELPGDVDIQLYLEKVLLQLESDTFFAEEAEYPLSLPGIIDIFFKNPRDGELREFVFIGKMVQYDRDIYFKDIEIIRLGLSGEVLLHLQAKYGKYVYADLPGNLSATVEYSMHNINFNCIGQQEASTDFQPAYLVGSLGPEDLKLFPILPPPEHLKWLSFGAEKYRTLGIVELWNIKEFLALYGYPEKELNLEFLTRALLPFLFLIFSFFAIAIGWQYRSRYGARPPVVTILLLPLFPLLVSVVCRLLIFISRLFFAFSLGAWGFFLSLIIGVCLQLILLSVAMFMVAGQNTH